MKTLSIPSLGGRHAVPAAGCLGRLPFSSQAFGIFAALSDACAVITASVASGSAYHWLAFGRIGSAVGFLGVGMLAAWLTVALMQMKGLYSPDSLLSVSSSLASIIFVWLCAFLFLLTISFTLKISDELSRGSVLSLACLAPVLILVQRILLRRAMLIVLQKNRLKRRKVFVIRQDHNCVIPSINMSSAWEFVDSRLLDPDAGNVRSELRSIVNALRGSSSIDEVHLMIDWSRWPQIKPALSELRVLPLPVRVVADATAREILRYPQQKAGGTFSFELQRAALQPADLFAKRAFDISVAALGLVALMPLLLLVALAIKIDSTGPVLFRQARGGFNGRAFKILKFRTMRVMEDGENITQAARDDERVTRLGRWLRRLSIDELPQLINVLRGDMSMVGPRPHALAHDRQYSGLISRYPFRHHVKPGITGWAQVRGFRGETPSTEQMNARVQLDLWYVRNWSLWLDLKIVFWTVLEVIRSRNAF